MVGLRVFDIGALIVWLIWFFRLRDDDDDADDGRGGGGNAPEPDTPKGPPGGLRLPLPDAAPVADAPPRPRRRAPPVARDQPPRRARAGSGARTCQKTVKPLGDYVDSTRRPMARWTPDPSFYPSPGSAAAGAAGDARLRGDAQHGQLTGRDRRARPRGRLGHLRQSSAASTCPTSATSCTTSAGTPARPRCARGPPHPHVERRYLLVPGLRSSRIHVLDVKDDPRSPKLVKVIEAEEIATQGRLQPPPHRPLRARRDLRLGARQPRGRRARAASSCSTTTTSRSRAPGRTTAARRSWPTTSGGT